MINTDILNFDQTHFLFLALATFGLMRERRILPFLIVAVGSLLYGSISAVILAGLILWDRIDRPCSRMIQLKDAVAYILILVGAIAVNPLSEFSILIGVLLMSFSFGRGGLGIIPALLLLRQYFPSAEPIEIIFGSAAFYWIMVEIIRWSKTSRAPLLTAILETLCTLGILFGMREYGLHVLEQPAWIVTGCVILIAPSVLASLLQWKGQKFSQYSRVLRNSLSKSLVGGKRAVSLQNPWPNEPSAEHRYDIEGDFNRLFVFTLVALGLLAGFTLFSRGGFN